ncbi:MAG TPA: serine hydrolase [Naasia sp.]|jgi:D-alanyl-D-alanine carboxypeptidase (penicillin-binding protein 5/6)
MAEGRERNRVVVALVAVLIVALAAYGPMALLAPLPSTEPTLLRVEPAGPGGVDPALPSAGSSALTLGAAGEPLVGGGAEARPMAAIAKVVTALLVLEEHPLEEGRSGPSITVTRADYDSFASYSAQGVRAVRVTEGDRWTEREALLAMLIASSNNHAELVARWAFGSVDNYLDAANTWLDEQGLDDTTVADATGLSTGSTGTAADLARLAAIASADPFLAEAVTLEASTTVRGVAFDNTIRYRPGDGILGLSRSYTDDAGVCLLFSVRVPVGDAEMPVYGAILGAASYEQLSDDMDALLATLPDALRSGESLPAGTGVARYETPWGQSVEAVTEEAIATTGWASAVAELPQADVRAITTARSGTRVGTLPAAGGGVAVILEESVRDPGPLWRLASPGVVLPRFWAWVTGNAG